MAKDGEPMVKVGVSDSLASFLCGSETRISFCLCSWRVTLERAQKGHDILITLNASHSTQQRW